MTDTHENDLKLLQKAVVEMFDRAGLSLTQWEGNGFLLLSGKLPLGKTIHAKHAKMIEQAFYAQGRTL